MIGNLRRFATTKFAGILVGIIIIPFVFMGMGSVFNSGNTNNIVKINKTNISTQDFMDYLNQSGLSQDVIKKNIDDNILEELLSTLVSTVLLDLEIKDLNLVMSENELIKRIKNNKNFQDDNGVFQRTLYEKFLLTNNMNAPTYEIKLKNNIMQKHLFTYISGGAKSPNFLVKKYYKEKNRKLNISYVNLNKFYKDKNDFTDDEIKTFINENSDKLKQDYIDFSYVVITPKNLTGLDEFNQVFFDKIDEIENKIAKNVNFESIVNELDITTITKNDYINLENKETIENKIYNSRINKIEIFEDKGKYIFYQINKINNKLPLLNNTKFKSQIKDLLFQKEKFEFNKDILEKINNKKFNDSSFNELAKNKLEKIQLKTSQDNDTFETNSVKILYSLPVNAFTLIADEEDNVFIAKILNYEEQIISENSNQFNAIINETSAQNRNSLLKSYDYLLNDKYEVIVNEKTLNRVKNYFR